MSELSSALADGNPVAAIIVLIFLAMFLIGLNGSIKDTQRYLDECKPDE